MDNKMKKIYKVLYPVGFQIFEVQDDYVVALPFVEEKPLENLVNEQSQFFNFSEQKWEEAVTQDYTKKLNLLENLANGLEVSNSELKQANEKLTAKAESLAQINSKTMLTSLQNTREIDAIKEQIGGAK
ncbi:hypothetical protein HMPREF9506_02167 [Enterococcus faecalis TX0309A]|nr:hypothetical protein HMPREF0348_2927 [Enterococcus faecalis TX0104]EEU86370.1 predicted protein [Enterococcus faecalis CH188]EFQ17585.1 hypothetical protein HMPREF9512_00108 [Enterococcus faecalis EnGen0311]EFU85818.1 hypothetical protein HMPREF9507_02803 [Enterococcus faecalis TX0309B]EFU93069.1 hypothetical protein HMPREF9506_02167 [Enterococcus faecalis TX0309A]EJU85410.1 hypothetical protein HMPREF1328_02795 [Enterococcus faecalis ERV103]EJU90533.1 hypothetical protein HMPREF1329_00626